MKMTTTAYRPSEPVPAPVLTQEEAFAKLYDYQKAQEAKWIVPLRKDVLVYVEKLKAANLRIEVKLKELGLPLSEYVAYTLKREKQS